LVVAKLPAEHAVITTGIGHMGVPPAGVGGAAFRKSAWGYQRDAIVLSASAFSRSPSLIRS
jgi:hypothetical protein